MSPKRPSAPLSGQWTWVPWKKSEKWKGAWEPLPKSSTQWLEEWQCPACSTTNWMSRPTCRTCTGPETAAPDATPCTYADAVRKLAAVASETTQDPKVGAASKVEALESALKALGTNMLLKTYRDALEHDLEKAKKAATDTRSLAKRLDQKQAYVERETKRMDQLTGELEAAQVSLVIRKEALAKEVDALAKLRAELIAEPSHAQMDIDDLTPEIAAEVNKMEAQELETRRGAGRKRQAGEADAAQELEKEADSIAAQIEHKRRRSSTVGTKKGE